MTDPKQVPIAIFNPTLQAPSDPDPWTSWGRVLGRTNPDGSPAPVLGMPNGVGVGDPCNYDGQAILLDAIPPPPFLLTSIGLTYPGGPALNDAPTAMVNSWGNAAGWIAWGDPQSNWWNVPRKREGCFIRPGWEMTGDWYAWGMNRDDGRGGLPYPDWCWWFKQAFDSCVTQFRGVMPNSPGVGAVFNPNGDFFTKGINLDDFVPPNWDVGAVDIYDFDWMGADTPDPVARWAKYQLPNLQAIDEFCARYGKYVAVCEAGAGACGDNPYFFEALATWVAQAQSPVSHIGLWFGDEASGYMSNAERFPNQKAAIISAFGP